MAKSVKLADIAKQCGVSTVTVSKALSGQKGVSEEMFFLDKIPLRPLFCTLYYQQVPEA